MIKGDVSLTSRELERLAARMVCVGFDGLAITPELREIIDRGVGWVILFTRNYESPQQLRGLCRDIKSLEGSRPILICVDQEGGRVQRFREGFTAIASMREIGRSGDEAQARAAGRMLARELRGAGIDMNLAPVLDVDSNPANPVIGERSFGADPQLVSRMGCAMIDGLQSAGVAACGKHFPGHGDTELDSHHHLPRLPHDLERLERIELPPFRAAIKCGVVAIMVAHIMFEALDTKWPASMSRIIVNDLLRGQLGFDGLVISDDLEMSAIADHFGIEQAVVRGAAGGVDLFPVCHRADRQHAAIDALIKAIERGEIDRGQLERSVKRQEVVVVRRFGAGCGQ